MNEIPYHMISGRAFKNRRGSRGGFSLVEVLVAIAILTVGVVAFLQLFPIGFFDLQVASNTSNADRLAQAELNRLTIGSGAQIQQIAAVEQIYADNTVQLDPNFGPDLPLTLKSQANNTGFEYQPASATAFEKYEYVGGELVRIANPVTSGSPANALLDFGPMETPSSYTYPNLWDPTTHSGFNSLDPGTHDVFFVHGLPWLGKSGDSTALTGVTAGGMPVPHDDPEVELSQDSPEYLIDYINGMIAFHQPSFPSIATKGKYNQTFVFQVRDSDTSPNAVEPKTFVFQTDWNGTLTQATEPLNTLACWNTAFSKPLWAPLTSAGFSLTAVNQPTTATETLVLPLVPGSDKLVRDFHQVGTYTDDPYEFTLTAPMNTSADVTANNRDVYIGQLLFNPAAANVIDNRGNPIQASVDYVVSDWHNIHEDKTVGSQVVSALNTSGTSVVRLTLNHLLRYNSTDQLNNKYDGVGHSGSAATHNDVYVYDLDSLSQLPAADYTVDYDNGSITVINQPAGEHLRVYYHPAYDWGMTILKPAASYQVVKTKVASPSPTLTGQVMVSGSSLYFPPCDAGRLVQVAGTITATDSSVSPAATNYIPFQELVTLAPGPGAAAGTACVVPLTSYLSPTQTYQDVNPTATGASITTRVIWREANQWRHRDVTTVKLPSSG